MRSANLTHSKSLKPDLREGERAFHSFRAQATFSFLSPWRGSVHQIILRYIYIFLKTFFFFPESLRDLLVATFPPPVELHDTALKDLRAWQEFLHLTRGAGF